jgi:hypothetical protein
MTTENRPPEPESSSIRLQILATEHWGLLATRSMTWSEVMSRISIHLTVCSASLVVIALVVQADGYGAAFKVLSVGLASAMLVLGTLTSMRVVNASLDDQRMIAGMNRLRAGYAALDPGVEHYFMTSWREGAEGVLATSTLGLRRSRLNYVVASTSFFINVVNAIVAGTVVALVAYDAGASSVAVGLLGCVAGLFYLGLLVGVARRRFDSLFRIAEGQPPAG